MTKSQIKAELRRSACEDEDPWIGVDIRCFNACIPFKDRDLASMRISDLRTFYLLVAEAL